MISDKIQRIEELRYNISKKTYELMQKKINGQTSNQLADLESELNIMKKELGDLLSIIQDAGYVYIFMHKKDINMLKESFAAISQEEKRNAFKGFGKGYEIMQKSLSLLQENYNKRKELSTLIISLPADESVVSKIKNVLEGYSETESFKLESEIASSRISSLLQSLGIKSESVGSVVYIGKKAEDLRNSRDVDKDNFVEPLQDIDELVQQETREKQDLSQPISQPVKLLIEEMSDDSKEVGRLQETSQRIGLTSEDLSPSLTYEEISSKIKEILDNYKMKRWVLGAFKNDEERKQYEKVQAILVKLMRLKQSMEEKGEK